MDTQHPQRQPLRIIREPVVFARTGLSRSERQVLEARGEFPARVPLGPRSIGWLAHEIDDWIAEKVAQRADPVKADALRVGRTPLVVRQRFQRETALADDAPT